MWVKILGKNHPEGKKSEWKETALGLEEPVSGREWMRGKAYCTHAREREIFCWASALTQTVEGAKLWCRVPHCLLHLLKTDSLPFHVSFGLFLSCSAPGGYGPKVFGQHNIRQLFVSLIPMCDRFHCWSISTFCVCCCFQFSVCL